MYSLRSRPLQAKIAWRLLALLVGADKPQTPFKDHFFFEVALVLGYLRGPSAPAFFGADGFRFFFVSRWLAS